MDVRELAAALVDLVLPGSCGGCEAPGPPWCPGCAMRLGSPTWPVVPGGPTVLAVGRYRGPLRTALLGYKERGRRDLAGPLAELLAGALVQVTVPVGDRAGTSGAAMAQVNPLWLVPAPSRPAAARARGGDHVLRLCRLLAARAAAQGREVRVARALRLARRARDSVGLDAAQRAANLAGGLHVRAGGLPPPGASVLLVDDVVTTGATLRACRSAMAATGVRADAALVLCDATSRP